LTIPLVVNLHLGFRVYKMLFVKSSIMLWAFISSASNINMFFQNFNVHFWLLEFSWTSSTSIVEQMIIEILLSFKHLNGNLFKCSLKFSYNSNNSSFICSIVKWSLWSSWIFHSIAYNKLCIELVSFIWFSRLFVIQAFVIVFEANSKHSMCTMSKGLYSASIVKNFFVHVSSRRGTFSVKFEIYVCQMTIFRVSIK
jgi:hypothetical protein